MMPSRLALLLAILSAAPLFAQDHRPVRSCESLAHLTLPNTTVESAEVVAADQRTPAWCQVTAIVTHPPAMDEVRVFIGLPMSDWNSRFQGCGGGGFSGGSPRSLPPAIAQGFAAGATDTGHEGRSGSFALDDQGRLDWMLIRDNAYLGIHEMTVTGKALVKAFYGAEPRYCYFNGCSTGGRQGLMEAQRFPDDYDGILSGCPAINWPQLHVAQLWGQLQMREANHFIPQCKFEAARTAAIEACDAIDGVQDGIIENPRQCSYEAEDLAGNQVRDCAPITREDAALIRKIWQGPRRQDGSFLWYGLPYGASFSGQYNTGGDPLEGKPSRITLEWFQYFLTQNPDWDWTTINHASYEHFWDQSVEQYGAVIGTRDPDLTAFRDRGGKAIIWHGWADHLIYAEGSIDYYERVAKKMGGPEQTTSFLRLFMAPGVSHCRGGDGPQPEGHFEALMKWVEEGVAPETLDAVGRDESGNIVRTRPLCPYPQVAQYQGNGSPDEAKNFACVSP